MSTQENIESISGKFIEYMDAVEVAIKNNGEDAVDLGMSVLRIEAAHSLIIGIFALVIILIAYKMRPKPANLNISKDDAEQVIQKGYTARSTEEDDIVYALTGSRSASKVPTDIDERLRNGFVDYDDTGVFIRLASVISVSAVSFIFMLVNLFDVWNWVGLFWPEAYVVHKFFM